MFTERVEANMKIARFAVSAVTVGVSIAMFVLSLIDLLSKPEY